VPTDSVPRGSPCTGDGIPRCVDGGQRSGRLEQQRATRLGELDPAGAADGQVGAELPFEGPDRRGQPDWATRIRSAARVRAIRHCDERLARYRAALDAGVDPSVVGAWIKEVQTERVTAFVRSWSN